MLGKFEDVETEEKKVESKEVKEEKSKFEKWKDKILCFFLCYLSGVQTVMLIIRFIIAKKTGK